jgi:tetratricopeptide (TPR) repeat protein
MDLQEKLAAEFPAVPAYRNVLAGIHHNLGGLLRILGKPAEAEAAYRRALDLYGKLSAEFPGVPEYRVDQAGTCCALGNLLSQSGRPADALPWYARSVELLNGQSAEPADATARRYLRTAHWGRAEALGKMGHFADAVPDWDQAIASADGGQRSAFRWQRADCLARAGRAAEAIAAANALTASPSASPAMLYKAACICSLASAAAKGDAPLRDDAATRAVELLRRAAAKGWRDGAALSNDSAFGPLRPRADYVELLWDLAEGRPTK